MTPDPAVALAGRPSAGAAGARLGELFGEHGRMVYGLCRLLLRDPLEAEDAAQQAFLSAYSSLLGGNEPREPAAWLAAIARNECRGRIRDRMREPLALAPEEEPISEGPDEAADRRAEIQALRAALRELPEKQREAVVLRDFYGFGYGEVGAALGVSRPAVQSLLFRGRRCLQGRLRPLRLASGALVVPLALRDSLAYAAPGFAAGSAASGGGSALMATALAKVSSAPLAAKLATATLAIGAAGTVGVVESRHSEPAGTRSPAVEQVREGGPPVAGRFSSDRLNALERARGEDDEANEREDDESLEEKDEEREDDESVEEDDEEQDERSERESDDEEEEEARSPAADLEEPEEPDEPDEDDD